MENASPFSFPMNDRMPAAMSKLNKTRRLTRNKVRQTRHGREKCASLTNASAKIRQMRRLAILIFAYVSTFSPFVRTLDLKSSVVETSIPPNGPEQKAVAMLVE